MQKGQTDVAFGVDAREVEGAASVADIEEAEEFGFGSFEEFEEGGVVDAAAGIGVDEADAALVTKWLNHLRLV